MFFKCLSTQKMKVSRFPKKLSLIYFHAVLFSILAKKEQNH